VNFPAIIGVKYTEVVLVHTESSKIVFRRANQRILELGMGICIDHAVEDISVVERA
jgi:hypothetical protein